MFYLVHCNYDYCLIFLIITDDFSIRCLWLCEWGEHNASPFPLLLSLSRCVWLSLNWIENLNSADSLWPTSRHKAKATRKFDGKSGKMFRLFYTVGENGAGFILYSNPSKTVSLDSLSMYNGSLKCRSQKKKMDCQIRPLTAIPIVVFVVTWFGVGCPDIIFGEKFKKMNLI